MLVSLWNFFFEICYFSKKPQDLPASKELLVLTLTIYGVVSFILALSMHPMGIAISCGLICAFLLAILSNLLLLFWRLPDRWIQTTTALGGTGIIFSIAAIPCIYLLSHLGSKDPLALWLALIISCLIVWNISVMAHIMKHALSSSFAMGVLAALFHIIVINITITSLFPQGDIG